MDQVNSAIVNIAEGNQNKIFVVIVIIMSKAKFFMNLAAALNDD